jgi:hypothetical protein
MEVQCKASGMRYCLWKLAGVMTNSENTRGVGESESLETLRACRTLYPKHL